MKIRLEERFDNMPKARRIMLWIVVMLMIFSVLWLSGSAVFNMFLNSSSEKYSGKITYNIGTENKIQSSVKAKKSYYFYNGQPYFDFSQIAALCNFRISGDENCMRFIFDNEANDVVTFFYDSNVAYINENAVIMDNPAYLRNSALIVPSSFAHNYMEGIAVTSAKKSITVIYDTLNISLLPDGNVPVNIINMDGIN